MLGKKEKITTGNFTGGYDLRLYSSTNANTTWSPNKSKRILSGGWKNEW